MKKTIAFTLAEVLITLGIIGVVAALTIPTLIANYQKTVTVNKIKKFYTNMNQVLMQAQIDNGDYSTWNYESSEDFYNRYIKPYIKNIAKEEKHVQLIGDFTEGIRFIFSDGTQADFSLSSNIMKYEHGKSVPVIVFYTNVNKRFAHQHDPYSRYVKKPKKERFYFIINAYGNLEVPALNEDRSKNLIDCNKKYNPTAVADFITNNGYVTCSTLIYKDGWKISDDYPW